MGDAASYLRSGFPALLELLQQSDVRELELRDGDVYVRLKRAPASENEGVAGDCSEPQASTARPLSGAAVTSPLVGTFYRAAQLGAPPLVEEGSKVDANTVVGIVEAMQVLTEVEAGCVGIVTRALATDGQPVEYGQSLFEVAPGG